MKRKILSFLLSLAIAFGLWLYVVTVVSPGSEKEYYNIPVVLEGETVLQERGLIEPCGRLAVPGRPTLFRTTAGFLRTFGITSVDELPPLPESDEEEDDGQLKLIQAINALQTVESAPEMEVADS